MKYIILLLPLICLCCMGRNGLSRQNNSHSSTKYKVPHTSKDYMENYARNNGIDEVIEGQYIKYNCIDSSERYLLQNYIDSSINGTALIIREWGVEVGCPDIYSAILIFTKSDGITSYLKFNDIYPEVQSYLIENESAQYLRIDNIKQGTIDSMEYRFTMDAGNSGVFLKLENGAIKVLGVFHSIKSPPEDIRHLLREWRNRIEKDTKYKMLQYVDLDNQ